MRVIRLNKHIVYSYTRLVFILFGKIPVFGMLPESFRDDESG